MVCMDEPKCITLQAPKEGRPLHGGPLQHLHRNLWDRGKASFVLFIFSSAWMSTSLGKEDEEGGGQ
jgi:hypothetical protein